MPTDRSRLNKKTGAPLNNALFQDILLELQMSNETQLKVVDEVKGLSSAIIIQSTENAAATEKLAAAASGTEDGNHTLLEQIRNSLKFAVEDLAAIHNLTAVLVEETRANFKAMSSKKLQDLEDKQDAEKKIAKTEDDGKDKDKLKPKDFSLGIAGTLLGLGALLAGFVAGFVAQVGNTLKVVLGGLAKFLRLDLLLKKILSIGLVSKTIAGITAGFKWIRELLTDVSTMLGVMTDSKIVSGIAAEFKSIKTGLAEFFAPISKLVRAVFGKNGSLFSSITARVGTILESLGVFGKWIGQVSSLFFKAGKVLGRLFVPVTVLMAAFDSVRSALTAFEKTGNLGDLFEGAVSGLLSSVIGAPLDALKSAVSWIVSKFGLKDVEKALDSFSFSDLISTFVERIVDWGRSAFENIFQTILDSVSDITDAFKKGDFLGGMKSIVNGWIKMMVALPLDLLKNTVASIGEIFGADMSKVRGFSFKKLVGGTNTETEGDKPTVRRGSLLAESAIKTEATRIKKDLEKPEPTALNPGQETDEKKSNLDQLANPGDLFSKFYDSLMEAYQNNASDRKNGADMSALNSSTADMREETAAQPVIVSAPAQTRPSISTSSQSVTYNQSNIPDRTSLAMMSNWSGF